MLFDLSIQISNYRSLSFWSLFPLFRIDFSLWWKWLTFSYRLHDTFKLRKCFCHLFDPFKEHLDSHCLKLLPINALLFNLFQWSCKFINDDLVPLIPSIRVQTWVSMIIWRSSINVDLVSSSSHTIIALKIRLYFSFRVSHHLRVSRVNCVVNSWEMNIMRCGTSSLFRGWVRADSFRTIWVDITCW